MALLCPHCLSIVDIATFALHLFVYSLLSRQQDSPEHRRCHIALDCIVLCINGSNFFYGICIYNKFL